MSLSRPLSLITVTDDISLELLGEGHAQELLHLVDQNREHLGKWLPWVPLMQNIDNFKSYIRQSQLQLAQGTDYGYVIVQNQKLVGRIGIHYIHNQNKSGAIGYWLGKEWEGRGIILRSCKALIDDCFSTIGLHRIEIKCGTGNVKSSAIPERLHFTKEGVLRQAEWVNGQFIDLTLYSLLYDEWNVRMSGSSEERK